MEVILHGRLPMQVIMLTMRTMQGETAGRGLRRAPGTL